MQDSTIYEHVVTRSLLHVNVCACDNAMRSPARLWEPSLEDRQACEPTGQPFGRSPLGPLQ